MPYQPKTYTAAPPPKKRGRSFERPSAMDAKPKKEKVERTEEQMRVESMAVTVRNAKAKRAKQFSKAQSASEAQWNLLSITLQTNSRDQVIRYVEFANQLPSGHGTLSQYEDNKIWLSRIYFIRAIDMAMKGYNELTSARREMLVSFGITDEQIDAAAKAGAPKPKSRIKI